MGRKVTKRRKDERMGEELRRRCKEKERRE